jgi:hypothetical protein
MAIKNLSAGVQGFLFNFFNSASNQFFSESPTVEQKELCEAFRRAAFVARSGKLTRLNSEIDNLLKTAQEMTDPVLQDCMAGVRLTQQQFYRGWVRDNTQLQIDLGSYSSKIF